MINELTIVGTGRVAHHLVKAFSENGVCITQVLGRDLSAAKTLAESVNSRGINKVSQLKHTDLIILAVSDDAISSLAIKFPESIPVVHTSGNTPILERLNTAKTGVFYPLQTFTLNTAVNWSEIPICLESNDDTFLKELFHLAEKISRKVKLINSNQRKKLHLAAVITCNFTNHLLALSEDYLNDNNLSIDLLKPLIYQTLDNLEQLNLKDKQTGPALREDYGTIANHLDLLEKHPDTKDLYLALSNHIIKYHHGQ